MKNSEGKRYLQKLQKQWIFSGLVSAVFMAAALSVLIISVWKEISPLSAWWILPLTILISILLILQWGILKQDTMEVSRLLNQLYPQLEESTTLILRSAESLNILEKFQVRKIEPELAKISTPKAIYRRLKISALLLFLALALAFGLSKTNFFNIGDPDPEGSTNLIRERNPIPDKILPEIESVRLAINPPGYTGRPPRQQRQFSAAVEEGSVLRWDIETTHSVKSFQFIFNDRQTVPLRPLDKQRTRWTLSKTISTTGFYQVSLDGKLSDLYRLETIRDLPAVIKILKPSQYSSIDFGEPQKVTLDVEISDDYGIKDAFIAATISSGKGEGVQFKEQKIGFTESFNRSRQHRLRKILNLAAMGMVPGDELYFYINARDSRQQESRSDMYIVTIQDTTQLMSLDGMLSGVNLVPEYFRSQRQIIIDSEKLIREEKSISKEEFNTRSNNLGMDQKLLRMRYGKFLGEETDEDIGGDHADGEHSEAEEAADFGNAEKLMDAVAHKHDIAEDATFFEPELKAQLKATLAEMWKSELRLRTHKPAEALPFEYKALRLLKDLQQKSRVYVAKTSFKSPPILEDKRLSGELDKIFSPSAERALTGIEEMDFLKRSTAVLARLKEGGNLSASDRGILQSSAVKLAAEAARQPSVYLKSFASLRKILNPANSKIYPSDINAVESALHRMIREEKKTPQLKKSGPGTALSREYFNKLQRKP